MKRLISVIFILFFIVSCTHFEASDVIYPEVSVVGNTIGLKYTIGPFEVADTLEGLDTTFYNHILEHKDNLEWKLKIIYNDSVNSSTHFKYYINDVLIMNRLNVISKDVLLMERDRLPNWLCIEGDCKQSSAVEEVTNEDPPKPKIDKPQPIENKQLQKEKRL